MSLRRSARAYGFTLVELMIVVAIVGVLAVLAVYGVRKYIANAKTAEARNSLGQISKDVAAAFERESFATGTIGMGTSSAVSRSLCSTQTNSVPAGPASIQGKKYQSAPGEWNVGPTIGFGCMKFGIDAPQYYMYTYAAGDTNMPTATFSATANGDLDGNGQLSTFSVQGSVQQMVLTISPGITEVSPEE